MKKLLFLYFSCNYLTLTLRVCCFAALLPAASAALKVLNRIPHYEVPSKQQLPYANKYCALL
jgi:hypothetical protein